MASSGEEEDDKAPEIVSKSVNSLPVPPSFLEVTCKNTGKVWRFAAGTEAVFAVRVINHKLEYGSPSAVYIESIKDGEEPVIFGPNAILVNYGEGWKLQTVLGQGNGGRRSRQVVNKHSLTLKESSSSPIDGKPKSSTALIYFGKIFLAFIFVFLIGGIFTYFLESLPRLITLFSDLF